MKDVQNNISLLLTYFYENSLAMELQVIYSFKNEVNRKNFQYPLLGLTILIWVLVRKTLFAKSSAITLENIHMLKFKDFQFGFNQLLFFSKATLQTCSECNKLTPKNYCLSKINQTFLIWVWQHWKSKHERN